MRREVLAEARSVGDVGPILLVETPAVGAPVAFGVLDKVIALPLLFMAQPDREARDLAIAHELAHHRSNDLLANFAAQAVLALHWWNPIAWLGWRAMRRDQEAACDGRVMAGRGREDRARYAALIAGIATGPRMALAAPMACPVLGEASILHRLRTLSRNELSPRRRWAGRALLATGALALPLTASISYAAAELPTQAEVSVTPPPPPPAVPDPSAPLLPASLEVPAAPPAPEVPALPPLPPLPEVPSLPHDEAFEARMEAFAERMEKIAETRAAFHEREAARLEREAERIEREAERIERQAERDAERLSRDLEKSAERQALASARSTLLAVRHSIATDRSMPEKTRREVLRELDAEIADLGRPS